MQDSYELPLPLAGRREPVIVSRVKGDGELTSHLKDLGFVEGSPVQVVSVSGADMIVRVKGTRLGLDASVAHHVLVRADR